MKKYQVLINCSIPQRTPVIDPKDRRTDLVMAGETVELTEEEARHLNTQARVPLVRLVKESKEPLPQVTGRHVSGLLRRPPEPPPDSEAARPDPAGSSKVMIYRDPDVPELAEPGVGDELSPTGTLDIVPGSPVNVEGGLRLQDRR
jgi:hypothetical protein